MRVLALVGLKGGVGKTSTAVNLAARSAALGFRTVLWDLDPQGAATWCVGGSPPDGHALKQLTRGHKRFARIVDRTAVPGLSIAAADLTLRNLDHSLADQRRPTRHLSRVLQPLRGLCDVVVVDTPPGLSLILENLIESADLLLLPVVPSPLSTRTLEQVRTFVAERSTSVPVAAFLSMVDQRKPLHRRLEAECASWPGFLSTTIPESSAVERMGEERLPTLITSPRSLAARRYVALWAEIGERLGLE